MKSEYQTIPPQPDPQTFVEINREILEGLLSVMNDVFSLLFWNDCFPALDKARDAARHPCEPTLPESGTVWF